MGQNACTRHSRVPASRVPRKKKRFWMPKKKGLAGLGGVFGAHPASFVFTRCERTSPGRYGLCLWKYESVCGPILGTPGWCGQLARVLATLAAWGAAAVWGAASQTRHPPSRRSVILAPSSREQSAAERLTEGVPSSPAGYPPKSFAFGWERKNKGRGADAARMRAA